MSTKKATCVQCRREKVKLFLKGDRCMNGKCPYDKDKKRDYPPGQHGRMRNPKVSDYGIQLREKQKVRRMYGVREEQFRTYFEKAERMQGITGINLLQLLERRLDNVVFRLGFAPSRRAARMMVVHRHLKVNGRIVNAPSIKVGVNDVIQVKDKTKKLTSIHDTMKKMTADRLVPWLELDKVGLKGTILDMPKREDIQLPIHENLIVELYSK